MSKVSLAEQIDTLEYVADYYGLQPPHRLGMNAALATLKLFQKYEPEVRDLLTLCIKRDAELPGSEIRVLTPQATGLSAIAQGRDEGGDA